MMLNIISRGSLLSVSPLGAKTLHVFCPFSNWLDIFYLSFESSLSLPDTSPL